MAFAGAGVFAPGLASADAGPRGAAGGPSTRTRNGAADHPEAIAWRAGQKCECGYLRGESISRWQFGTPLSGCADDGHPDNEDAVCEGSMGVFFERCNRACEMLVPNFTRGGSTIELPHARSSKLCRRAMGDAQMADL